MEKKEEERIKLSAENMKYQEVLAECKNLNSDYKK